MEKMILLNPGPVMVSERVRRALMNPDMCHREVEFGQILTRIRDKLLKVYGGDEKYTVVVFTGSGTAALDAALSSGINEGQRVLIISNGAYGERIEKIANTYGIENEVLRYAWWEPINLDEVEEELKKKPYIDVIAMVHHGTSTGIINPVHEVGDLTQKYGKTFIVDAISSLGGEKLNVKDDHIDFCVSVANKCLQGFPGASFVCCRRNKLEAIKNRKPRTFYLDLYRQFEHEENSLETPFTPAVQIFLALEEALDELMEEGIDNRIKRYRSLADILRMGMVDLGLKLLIPQEYLSNTITSVLLPDGISYESLHDRLKERGFIIYAGQGPVSKRIFRVANMGVLTTDDIYYFLQALKVSLKELGI